MVDMNKEEPKQEPTSESLFSLLFMVLALSSIPLRKWERRSICHVSTQGNVIRGVCDGVARAVGKIPLLGLRIRIVGQE